MDKYFVEWEEFKSNVDSGLVQVDSFVDDLSFYREALSESAGVDIDLDVVEGSIGSVEKKLKFKM